MILNNECINMLSVRLNPMVLSRDEVSKLFCVWIIFVEVWTHLRLAVFFNCSLDVATLTVHEDYASLKVNNKIQNQTVTVAITVTVSVYSTGMYKGKYNLYYLYRYRYTVLRNSDFPYVYPRLSLYIVSLEKFDWVWFRTILRSGRWLSRCFLTKEFRFNFRIWQKGR